jgi:hypothetical protein
MTLLKYLEEVSTRGHSKKIRRQLMNKSNLSHQFFTKRITEKCNILNNISNKRKKR